MNSQKAHEKALRNLHLQCDKIVEGRIMEHISKGEFSFFVEPGDKCAALFRALKDNGYQIEPHSCDAYSPMGNPPTMGGFWVRWG